MLGLLRASPGPPPARVAPRGDPGPPAGLGGCRPSSAERPVTWPQRQPSRGTGSVAPPRPGARRPCGWARGRPGGELEQQAGPSESMGAARELGCGPGRARNTKRRSRRGCTSRSLRSRADGTAHAAAAVLSRDRAKIGCFLPTVELQVDPESPLSGYHGALKAIRGAAKPTSSIIGLRDDFGEDFEALAHVGQLAELVVRRERSGPTERSSPAKALKGVLWHSTQPWY